MGNVSLIHKSKLPKEPNYTATEKKLGAPFVACPFLEETKENEIVRRIIRAYFKNDKDEEINQIVMEKEIILVLESENMEGQEVIIELPYKKNELLFKDQVVGKDDVVKLSVKSAIEKIEFKVNDDYDKNTSEKDRAEKSKNDESKKPGHYYSSDGTYTEHLENGTDLYIDGVKQEITHDELIRLAGVSYGEGSTANVYEEMAGIANVVVRQSLARKKGIMVLLGAKSTFAFAASDGNPRVKEFNALSPEKRNSKEGMVKAIKGAINALHDGNDYSNGAYFWDGVDIKTNYEKHPKIILGFKFTSPAHNIFSLENKEVDVTTYWFDKNKKITNKVRGKYTFTYETTQAHGSTVFSKYTDEFIKATGNKAHK